MPLNPLSRLLFVITLAVCLTQFASEIYAPSIPSMALNLNTNINLVQWSMAIYMVGVSGSQLIYGPISEGIGRKTPLLVGLMIMLVGTLICLFAPGIQTLIWGRLIQGCGAGACAALWRSIFRDVFTGADLAKYGSYLGTFIVFIVPTAPLIGGYLQEAFGWRACFVFMSVYALVAFFTILRSFQETSQHHHPERLKFTYIRKTYRSLLTSPVFMGITSCSLFSYGAFFAWFVTAPVLLIKKLGISPVEFGWFTFLGAGTTLSLASWLNGQFVKKLGMPNMMRLGWAFMIVSGLLMLALPLSVGGIIAPALLFYFGTAFVWPNAFAIAFTPFGQIAGYAGALYGFMQLGGGALLGGLMAYLPEDTQIPLAIVMTTASLCALLIHEILATWNKKHKRT